VERLVKSLARRGREREGAQVVRIGEYFLGGCSCHFFGGVPVPLSNVLILGGLQPRHNQESSLYPLLACLSQ
jgi:hypothetical protein